MKQSTENPTGAIQRLTARDFAANYRNQASPKMLLDTRSYEETALGMLKDAVVVPMEELEETAKSLPHDQPLFLYCRSGNRAQIAAQYLSQLGYKDMRVAINCGFEQLQHELPVHT
jgi:rhodanese-related sulfurtransferase